MNKLKHLKVTGLTILLLSFSFWMQAQTVTYNTPGGAIPSAGTSGTDDYTVTVTEFGELVSVDEVSLYGVVHTFASDLEVDLISPAGTSVSLFYDDGGIDGLNAGGCTITLTPTSVNDPDDWDFAGDTVDPCAGDDMNPALELQGGGLGLDAFVAGQCINGDWILRVTDDAGGDVGSFTDFDLVISYTDQPTCDPATAPIPTLSQWGLIILLISLAIVGIVFMLNTNPRWKHALQNGFIYIMFFMGGTMVLGFEYYQGIVENPTFERLQGLYQQSNDVTLPMEQVKGMVETDANNLSTWQSVKQFHDQNPGADPAAVEDLRIMVEGMEEKMSQ